MLSRIIYYMKVYYYSAFAARRIPRRFVAGASAGFSCCTPASSGSIMIRPQFSQTIIFFLIRISIWRCGGILLKQPEHASRSTYTIPRPLRELLRIRLNEARRRDSIFNSRSCACSRSFSSSAFVSATISSQGPYDAHQASCLTSQALQSSAAPVS